MSMRSLFKLGKSRNHANSRYDSFDSTDALGGGGGGGGDDLITAVSASAPSASGGALGGNYGSGLPASAWASVEMPTAEESYPTPPMSPNTGDAALLPGQSPQLTPAAVPASVSSQSGRKGRRSTASGSAQKYASLDDDRATQLEAVAHDVFIVHKGWKEDTDVVNTIAEKLHASPMKVNCITLATSKPSAGVVMASYPHDPSIPELSAEHPAVVGGFTRCLENTRLSSSSPGNHAPGSMLARAEAAAVKGNSSTSSLASHMSSQTPPIARASTSATKVTLPSRTVSLGRRRGQKMRSEAGTFDSNVRLMMERFNAAKVLVILYDRQCLSVLPEPLVALACLQHKLIVPVTFMGQQGLLTQLSTRSTYVFNTTKFFFVDRTTRDMQFSNVVSHITSCLRPSPGNPLSLRAPESLLVNGTTSQGDTTAAAVTTTGDLIDISSFDSDQQQQQRGRPALTIDDLLGLGSDEQSPLSNPSTVSFSSAPQDSKKNGRDSGSGGSSPETVAMPAQLDDKTTGEALWRELFKQQQQSPPSSVDVDQLCTAVRQYCNEPMARLFRRDKDRDEAAQAVASAVCGGGDGSRVTHDEFVALVQRELTGSGASVLEKAMGANPDWDDRLDVLLWCVLSRWMAEVLCRLS